MEDKMKREEKGVRERTWGRGTAKTKANGGSPLETRSF